MKTIEDWSDIMEKPSKIFNNELKVINIGLDIFYNSLKSQKVSVAHVEWKPPAGGNEELLAILKKLK